MNMKLKRISMGLTQRDLRDKSGVALGVIVQLEKGQIDSTKVGILKKIAAALDSDIITLFFS